MARPAARRGPTVMNTAARGRQSHPLGGLELPDDWLAWKPFGVARQLDSRGPVEKVVETEADLHIFGLVGAVHVAAPAAQEPATPRRHCQPGRTKAFKCRAETTFAPHQQLPGHPPNRYDESGGTGRDGGGWGMATGQETPSAAGHEQRRSAAIPRAFAMNTNMNTDQAGFEQGGRAQFRSGAPAPQPPPYQPPPLQQQQQQQHHQQHQQQHQQQQHPHPSQHWAVLNGGACHGFRHDEGQGQVQGYPNGSWQQDQQQPPPPPPPQQQQYGAPPSSHLFPPRCPPAPFLPHQFLPPPMPPQYPHVQHAMPPRPYMNSYQGQCYGCCRGPCQCEHVY